MMYNSKCQITIELSHHPQPITQLQLPHLPIDSQREIMLGTASSWRNKSVFDDCIIMMSIFCIVFYISVYGNFSKYCILLIIHDINLIEYQNTDHEQMSTHHGCQIEQKLASITCIKRMISAKVLILSAELTNKIECHEKFLKFIKK